MEPSSGGTRLNKFIARHSGISRREADDLIADGHVQINGSVASLGAQVTDSDVVKIKGELLTPLTTATTILLNKPVGYVCSRRRQGDSPTIYELLPEKYHSLKPVGRLDRDSSGIILLTDDGDFAHQMTHPSFHKRKVYEVTLDTPLQPLHRQMISDFGVMLEDGKSQFELERIEQNHTPSMPSAAEQPSSPEDSAFPAELGTRTKAASGPSAPDGGDGREATRTYEPDTHWRITMHEGRNRQIRRTFAALGYTVTKLHRTEFGTYTILNLDNAPYTVVSNPGNALK